MNDESRMRRRQLQGPTSLSTGETRFKSTHAPTMKRIQEMTADAMAVPHAGSSISVDLHTVLN